MNDPHKNGNHEDSPDGGAKPRQGETRWSQVALDGTQTPAPKQPNERDESSSSQAGESASMGDIGKLAHHDAETSMDTDRGPVLDAVYNGAVTEGHRAREDEKLDGARDADKKPSTDESLP